VDFLQDCGLAIPGGDPLAINRREHTAHLKILVAELQSVARSEPEAGW
jgi:hypothetical protein